MSFVGQFQNGLRGYFGRTLPYYFAAAILFVTGVVFGALAVTALTASQKADLLEYLEVFLRGLGQKIGDIETSAVLRQSALANLKTAGVLWLLGASVIGAPLAMGVVFVRGFVIGFSTGFLFSEMGLKGLALSLFAVLPPNLIAVPAILALGVSAAAFAVLVLRRRSGAFRVNLAQEFLAYTFTCLILAAGLLAASVLEAYVTPFMMNLVAGF